MQKFLFFAVLLIFYHVANAQDEGPITKKARVVSNANTLSFGVGPAFSLTGDYGVGFNAMAGFLKRRNRFFSVGPFVSYSTQKYSDAKDNNVFIETGGYEIRKNRIDGGNLGIVCAGSLLRFDFIPNERVKKISPYAILKPFIMLSSRKSLTVDSEEWYRDESTDMTGRTWYYSGTTTTLSANNWGGKSEFGGGMNIGLGLDFIVSSGMSLFVQTGIGLTTPLTHIDTGSFNHDLTGYQTADYPFAKKTFVPLNLAVGISYTY